MRTLLLLRHAKAQPAHRGQTDSQRCLNETGRKAAKRTGRWLEEHRLNMDYVSYSPALRAVQTLELVREEHPIGEHLLHMDTQVYMASLDTLLSILSDIPADAETVLLVGHNPALEELLVHLCGEDMAASENGKLLPTASLAHIILPDDWRRLDAGQGHLMGIIRPKEPH